MRHTLCRLLNRALACAALPLAPMAAQAQLTDIANTPLTYSLATQVKPNVMFILDDSGSMAYRFMPEAINDSNIDKSRCNNSSCSSTTTAGIEGNPPWYAYQINTIYYNPQITYVPAVDGNGNLMTSYGSPWTSVKVNAFVGNTTINLVSGYPEIVYCKSNNDNPTSTSNCRRNGIDTGNPFVYNSTSSNGFPNGTSSGSFRFPVTRPGNPFYYNVLAREYCSDVALTTCTMSDKPTGNYVHPAPLRFCQNSTDANSNNAVTGNTSSKPRCQESWSTSHKYGRYGRFERVDIVPATKVYSNRIGRTDCANGSVCTYAEEMTNFANWYAYYSSRMQLMKTAVGYAFLELDGRYRVGFITINPGSPVSSSKYTAIDTFSGSHRTNWYSKLYAVNPSGGTPLREALSRVGRHYAGIKNGINQGMNQDPIQYSCQPNVAILSTDGYWNGAAGDKIDGNAIGNHDNADDDYSTRASGAYDGGLKNASGTLADVAMYYYSADLRTNGSTGALGIDVSENNVPTTTRDMNSGQHMMTFTLGMGLGGFMRYLPNYESATFGDFYAIRTGNTGCAWQSDSAVCNWPVPPTGDADDPSKLDDLWHAAVNGRGRFVSANDAATLYDGLVTALADLRVLVGSAAASATSSPNITTTDNAIYSSTYRTTRWDGEMVAQRIDASTGNVVNTIQWSARDKLNAKTSAATDARTIYTAGSSTLVPFAWDSMDSTTRAYFSNKCSQLSQCAVLTTDERTIVNNGENLVNFLRGQRQHELLFREREYVLGDLVGSRPAFVRDPRRAYGDADVPSYFDFKNNHASRQPVVYIGGNDGMLHAFDANDGTELWAFVPRTVLPRLYKLAEGAYATQHEFYVDGSPAVNDAFVNGQWRTILIGGMNAGGRGYYALDVTNPLSPQLLWEFCSTSLCPRNDGDLGLSFGNPVITKRSLDGKWVAVLTSGYNNVGPGEGRGYLYVLDLGTGALLHKVSTGVGSTTDPSGLARISNWVRDPDSDATAQYVYGGDLKGNLWRFDLGASPPGVLRLATLKDSGGKGQPITTRPELGQIDSKRVIFVGSGRYLGSSDLQDPTTLSPAGDWSYSGSLYAVKDGGSAIGNPRSAGTFKKQTIVEAGNGRRRITGTAVNWGTDSGWFIDFPSVGERMNLDPQLVLGTLVATTNVPNNNACTAGGDSWIYQFNYKTGQSVTSSTGGEVGLFRSGTLTVGNAIVRLQNLSLKIITTGASGVKETRGLNVGGGAANPRRIGWREVAR